MTRGNLTKLKKKLIPEPDGEDVLRLRSGVVSAINSDGTCDVVISGVTVPKVPRLQGAIFAVGSKVQMITYRGSMLALGRVAAAGEGALLTRKSSSQNLNASSTTLQNVTGLSVPVAANAIYFWRAWILYSAASNTPDLRINYSIPSGASLKRTDWGPPSASTTAADTIDTTSMTTGDNGRGAGTSERSLYVEGELVTSTSAGTFQVQAAQVTSSTDLVSVNAGSRLQFQRYS